MQRLEAEKSDQEPDSEKDLKKGESDSDSDSSTEEVATKSKKLGDRLFSEDKKAASLSAKMACAEGMASKIVR